MKSTRSALAELNRAFYAKFADDFARTRRGWPPGFERILPHLRPAANVLDVGCGNGRLLAFLIERGWRGRYLGLDSSAGLLAEAEQHAEPDADRRIATRSCRLICSAPIGRCGRAPSPPTPSPAWPCCTISPARIAPGVWWPNVRACSRPAAC